MKSLGLYLASPQGLKFLHSDILENALKIFFSRTATPNGTIFTWSIPRTRRFKFVQIKSLGSYMAPPQGLKYLHSDKLGND